MDTQQCLQNNIPRKSEYSIDVDGRGKLKNNFNLPSRYKKSEFRLDEIVNY